MGIVTELHGDGNTWRIFNTVADRGDMLEADQGDLKKIWDEERRNFFVDDEQF